MSTEIHDAIQMLLGSPRGVTQKYFLLVLGLLVTYLLFSRIHRTFGTRETDPTKDLILVVIGGAVVVMSIVLARLYLLPRMVGHDMLVLVISPIAGTLLITLPVMCFWQKVGYLSAATAWGLSLAAAACVLVIARAGIDAVSAGRESLETTRERTEEVQGFLGQH